MRKTVPFLFVIILSMQGAAQLESEVTKTCGSGSEPLVSMPAPNKTYSNIGTANMYEYKVCVDGISESYIGPTCEGNVAFYISSKSTSAHFSAIQGYNMRVCSGNMVTEIKNSCGANQTALFSVSDKINGFGRHVAGLYGDVYDNVVCGRKSTPSTVKVTMSYEDGDVEKTFFDDQEVGSFQYSSIAEFPYIVNEDSGIVSGIVASSFREARKKNGNGVKISLKRDIERSGFMLPLTKTSHENIEDDQSDVLNKRFLDQSEPNFAGFPPGKPDIRAMFEPEVDLESNLSISSGTYELKLEKTDDNEVTIGTR